MNQPSTTVSPGLGGFLAFFFLAIALWLLVRNMTTRLQRLRFREEREEQERAQREAELRDSGDPAAGRHTGAGDGVVEPGDGDDPQDGDDSQDGEDRPRRAGAP